MNLDYGLVNGKKLRIFVERLYKKYGFSKQDQSIIADVLLSADYRGIDSHGVSRLHWYDEWIEKKLINLNPDIRIVQESETTARVNGDNGMGMVVSQYAMQIAINKAKKYGSGFVSVEQSNHFGIAGYYSMMALKEGMIGISMTNMIPIVAPIYGIERKLGTNPISFALPTNEEDPFVLDMATTAVSGGKLEIAMREERDIPLGLVIDKNGKASVDPKAPWEGGALLPLGGDYDFGGHKGYGLATLVNALSGALSGSIYGIDKEESVLFGKPLSKKANVGHFFGAIRIDGFRPKDEVKESMDQMLRSLKNSKPMPNHERVYVAGEKEFINEKERKKNGIPLHIKTIRQLREIGKRHGIDISLFNV